MISFDSHWCVERSVVCSVFRVYAHRELPISNETDRRPIVVVVVV